MKIEKWNPSVKAITILISVILLSFSYVIRLNVLVFGISLFLLIFFSDAKIKHILTILTPAMIAAFGLFTDVSYETDQDLKNILGHVAYLLEGVKRLFDIKSYKMTIHCGEESWEGEFIYGMVTNSRSVGGFKHLTGKNVDMNDGLFEVTLIRKPKNPLELQEIVGALLTAEDNSDLIYSVKASEISFSSDEAIPWTLDGEFGGKQKYVNIVNMHKALKIFLERDEK